jgi:VWFA-related protein
MSFELSSFGRATILLLGTALLATALRKASASTKHTIWIIGLFAALLMTAASFVLPSINLPLLVQSGSSPVNVELDSSSHSTTETVLLSAAPHSSPVIAAGNAPSVATPAMEPSPVSIPSWSRVEWVWLVWGLGSLAVLIRGYLGVREVYALRRNSQPFANEWATLLLADLKQTFSISSQVELRVGGQDIPPMTWGILGHTILLPIAASGWTKERMRVVLAHELAHVKRRDGLAMMVTLGACAAYWINPLVWYAAYRMRIERENACDDQVLNLGADAEDYADHLLEIARGINAAWPAALSMADGSHFEERLRSILDTARNRRQLSRLSTVSLSGCAVLLSLIGAVGHLTTFAMPLAPQVHVAPNAAPEPVRSAAIVTQRTVPQRRGASSAVLVGLDFIRLTPGTFVMGCSAGDTDCKDDEKPAHRVRITKGFEIGKYEVTQEQWQTVIGNNPSSFKGTALPVESVTWDNVQDFLARLNARNDGYRYRLPTEAEWEYAARAGSAVTPITLDTIEWYGNNSGRLPLDTVSLWKTDFQGYGRAMINNGNQTHAVGLKRPNAWNLHDMLGNVQELVQDWYDPNYYKASPAGDPKGPPSGDYHVARGGYYFSSGLGSDSTARVSSRSRGLAEKSVGILGKDTEERIASLAAAGDKKAADAIKAGGVLASRPSIGIRIVREPLAQQVLVNATVWEEGSNRLVTGLRREDFQLWEDKSEQTIETLTEEPVSVGLIIGGLSNGLNIARDAAVSFLKAGSADDEYFLTTLSNGSAFLEQDFTTDIAKAQNDGIKFSGGALQLYDGMYLGIQKLRTANHSRKVLVVLVNGNDNGSRYKSDAVRDLAIQEKIRVFIIAMGMNEPDRTNADALARDTTASAFFPASVQELDDIFARIAVAAKQKYVLGYRSTNPNNDGLWRKITVKVHKPGTGPDLITRATAGYYAPKP